MKFFSNLRFSFFDSVAVFFLFFGFFLLALSPLVASAEGIDPSSLSPMSSLSVLDPDKYILSGSELTGWRGYSGGSADYFTSTGGINCVYHDGLTDYDTYFSCEEGSQQYRNTYTTGSSYALTLVMRVRDAIDTDAFLDSSSPTSRYLVKYESGITGLFGYSNVGGNSIHSGRSLDGWHYVAVVFGGSTSFINIDGSIYSGNLNFQSATNLYALNQYNYSQGFRGDVSDYYLFRSALSNSDITSIYEYWDSVYVDDAVALSPVYSVFGFALTPGLFTYDTISTVDTNALYPENGIPEVTTSTGSIPAGCGQYVILPESSSGVASLSSISTFFQYGKYKDDAVLPYGTITTHYSCQATEFPTYDVSGWNSYVTGDFFGTEYLYEDTSGSLSMTCGSGEKLHIVIHPEACDFLVDEEKMQVRLILYGDNLGDNSFTSSYLDSACPFNDDELCEGYELASEATTMVTDTFFSPIVDKITSFFDWLIFFDVNEGEEYCIIWGDINECNTVHFSSTLTIFDLLLRVSILFTLFSMITSFFHTEK